MKAGVLLVSTGVGLISCSGEDESGALAPLKVFASRSEWQRLFFERR
jgi:hypothetical protein